MPRIFSIIVKRAAEAVVGAINFRADQRAGFRLNVVGSWSALARPVIGFRALLTPITATTLERLGFRVSASASGTAASPLQRAGFRAMNSSSGTTSKPVQRGEARIVRHWAILNGVYGATTVAELATGGRTDWANDNNALGKHDGVSATLAGDALAARAGTLQLNYADFPNKDQLTVTAVRVRFFHRLQGTLANNGDQQLQVGVLGSWHQVLQSVVADVDNLAAGNVFALTVDWGGTPGTGKITSWSDLNNLYAQVLASCGAAELHTHTLDAVELEVDANRTDTL
jgi:hypothetical protein